MVYVYMATKLLSSLKNKNNLGFLIIILILGLLGGMIVSSYGFRLTEGFSQVSTYSGDLPASYNVREKTNTQKWGTPDMMITPGTATWGSPNLTVTKGGPISPGVANILSREPQPVPLPEGEMLLFANTPFKPECCPNTYSNSN